MLEEKRHDQPAWHTLGHTDVEQILNTSPHGLSLREAKARLAHYGHNQLEESPPPSNLAILLHQFRSPLIYILLIATVVTILLEEFIDAGVIAAVLVLNAIIGFTQERRAEMSVRALMKLVSPRARVIREGRGWEIESRDLVPGDLVLLESGARVPADIRLTSTTALAINESLLTGESVPVIKQTMPLDREVELADRVNMAYMGSVVTSGRGRGYVVGTGAVTALGAIAERIRSEEEPATPLQQRMNYLARVIGIIVAVASAAAFAIGVGLGESVIDMFMVAVALAVAAIPEGLPVAFTIALALGVRRMAHRNAIIRRLPAVETLGSTTTIGSDKTGTLTENRMTVQEIWTGGNMFRLVDDGSRRTKGLLAHGGIAELPEHEPLYLTLLAGVLANEAGIYLTEDGFETQGTLLRRRYWLLRHGLALSPKRCVLYINCTQRSLLNRSGSTRQLSVSVKVSTASS